MNSIKAFGLIGIVITIALWQVVFVVYPMKWDIIDITLPWKYFVDQCIENHSLPLWNPYFNSGFPQMGHYETWNPITWILSYYMGYDPITIQLEYWLLVLLSGWGSYKLFTFLGQSSNVAVLSAVAMALCGFFVGHAQHLGFVASGTWIIYISYYYLYLNRYVGLLPALKLALSLFLLLTGGYPGLFVPVVYLLIFSSVVLTLRKYFMSENKMELKKWLVANSVLMVFFFSLSAIALASSFQLSGYVNRGEGLDFSGSDWGILTGSLTKRSLISLLAPYALTIDAHYYGSGGLSHLLSYIGIIPLVFCLYYIIKARKEIKTWLLVFVAFLSFGLAMANDFPLRKLLFDYLPFMDLFRFSTIYRFFGMGIIIFLSGLGISIWQKDQLLKRVLLFAFFSCIAVVTINFEESFFTSITKGFSSFNEVATRNDRIVFQGLIQSIIIILSLFVLLIIRNPVIVKRIFFLVICLDMICFSQWMMPHFLIRKNIDMSALKTSFENLPKGFVTPPITIPMNELTDSNSKKIYGIWRNVNIYHKIPSSDGYSPYSLQNTMDKVELVFDENIKKKPLVFLNNSTGESKFETIKFSQNQLTLRTHTMEENILCYNQNYYPGWTARIDGVETKIIGNNEEIIATRLAQGIHEVSFSFEPKGIKQIFVFSASALILCIGLIVFFTFYQGKSILSKLAVGLLFVMFVPLIVKGLSQRKTSDKEVINWISQTIRKIKSTDDFNLELYIATSRELNSSIIDKYTQVNFHRKNDLAKFQKFLAESKGNKIAFVCVNHQIPEQAKKMLTYYFGEKTDTYQYEDATIELYDRRNSFTHSRGCIQLNEDCSADNALCDKTIVIDSTRKYFTLYQQSIENICDEFPCDITAVLRVKDDLGANANFVISIIDEDGKGQSKGEKILNETTKANNWGEVFLTYRVESHQKRGEAKFFISKEKNKNVVCKDMKIISPK